MQARLEVDDLVAGDLAALALGLDRVLDRRDELARDAAADDLVGELDARARGRSGSKIIFTSANWPEPPDCFLCV